MNSENPVRRASSRHSAFSLGELMIAILCLAVLMLPLLAYVSGLGGIGYRVAMESGTRSWHSLQGAAVTQGLDSSSVSLLSRALNPGASVRPRSVISSAAGDAVAGRVSIGEIHMPGNGSRLGAFGLQLGTGSRLPDVEVPLQPLAPRTMAPPLLSPASGSTIPLDALAASGRLTMQARSSEGGQVFLRLDVSQLPVGGLGMAAGDVPADLLAAGLRGEAWVEFAGELVPGATRVVLSDGRAEWHVPESGGERLVSPSERVCFSYVLDLGSPVLRIGTGEYATGAEVPVDILLLTSLGAGRGRFDVDWPSSVYSILGDTASSCVRGFATEFEGLAGPVGGDLRGFAGEPGLSAWGDVSRVAARPLLGGACRGQTGLWMLRRELIQLPPPELVGALGGPIAAGSVGFIAAELGELGRLGRLSARNGSVVSAGTSLDLEVGP